MSVSVSFADGKRWSVSNYWWAFFANIHIFTFGIFFKSCPFQDRMSATVSWFVKLKSKMKIIWSIIDIYETCRSLLILDLHWILASKSLRTIISLPRASGYQRHLLRDSFKTSLHCWTPHQPNSSFIIAQNTTGSPINQALHTPQCARHSLCWLVWFKMALAIKVPFCGWIIEGLHGRGLFENITTPQGCLSSPDFQQDLTVLTRAYSRSVCNGIIMKPPCLPTILSEVFHELFENARFS